jgi:Holliday junction resolvase RusA-like endonuclease
MHYRKYQALRDEVLLLTMAATEADAEMYRNPVWLFITAYNRKPLDADNVAAKLYVDALRKRGLLKDDDPRYVRGVALQSKVGDPRVEITIRETYEMQELQETIE